MTGAQNTTLVFVAMALWILGIGTSCGVCHPSMTTKVIVLWTIMQHLLQRFYASVLNVILADHTLLAVVGKGQ